MSVTDQLFFSMSQTFRHRCSPKRKIICQTFKIFMYYSSAVPRFIKYEVKLNPFIHEKTKDWGVVL